MAIDRTPEFNAAVLSVLSKVHKSPAESRRLLSSNLENGKLSLTAKSEFMTMAAKIGRDINSTGGKLQRLTQCKCFSEDKSTYQQWSNGNLCLMTKLLKYQN